MLTHGELFAGISGFGLGFERAGIKTLWHVEIDAACQSVLRRHYPDALILSDVCKCGAHNLPQVDIISFGSPCQDMSVAGKRTGLNGKRSGLFFKAIRIVAELQPAFAVWENVPGAFSSNSGRDFAAVLSSFRECGARDIAWGVLDAQYFGVAQRRRRVFLIADFREERAAEVLFEREGVPGDSPPRRETGQGVAGSIGGSSQSGGFRTTDLDNNGAVVISPIVSSSDTHSGFRDAAGIVAHALRSEGADITNAHKAGDSAPVVFQDSQYGCQEYDTAGTLREGRLPHHQMTIQSGVRRLTPRECERLQGFPDDWTRMGKLSDQGDTERHKEWHEQSDSARYRQLGNAVCVPVIEWLGRRIMEVAQ